ncbi:MAG TPA: ATPase, T2SS/T4P/T4SS family [Conexibacter sp.]|nr:ATPase, T2SS/T4P/T4SS family [Conexibacter sp.]
MPPPGTSAERPAPPIRETPSREAPAGSPPSAPATFDPFADRETSEALPPEWAAMRSARASDERPAVADLSDRRAERQTASDPGDGSSVPALEGALALNPREDWNGVTPPSQRGRLGRFLGDVLVELGFATRERVDAAVETARASGRRSGRVLIEQSVITEDQLARAVAERYGLDHLDLSAFQVDMTAANLIDSAAAKRYEAVPVAFCDEATLLVAMADPANVLAADDLAMLTRYDVRPAVASAEDIAALIARLDRFGDSVREAVEEEAQQGEDQGEIVELRESADDAPVVKLVNSIVGQAAERGASDIHFEPDGNALRVRFRIDGVLSVSTTVPQRMVAGVISRIKIMAELDIAERRIPQDGRVGLTVDGHRIDIRVVTLPSVHGESIVMRLLDKEKAQLKLDRLGFPVAERKRFERAFSQSHGAVLVTGPTGSGKSTSLYAALAALNTPEKNIITIEDPVEYQLEGITQVQVNPRAGLTFATGLRSMMRADPDIIMVGEIRDGETAQIAIESALTGHLVLSTLHTNDAPTAITRLIEMGIEPFLVASAIDCVVAQRLARTLCPSCKKPTKVPAQLLRDNGWDVDEDLDLFEPAGCRRCSGMGYKGRLGLYEVMTVSEEIRRLILARAPSDDIAEVALREGMRRLRDDGLEKARAGHTTIAEIARVTAAG